MLSVFRFLWTFVYIKELKKLKNLPTIHSQDLKACFWLLDWSFRGSQSASPPGRVLEMQTLESYPQVSYIRICILTRPLDDLQTHFHLRSWHSTMSPTSTRGHSFLALVLLWIWNSWEEFCMKFEKKLCRLRHHMGWKSKLQSSMYNNCILK